jgi:hypothetical protein
MLYNKIYSAPSLLGQVRCLTINPRKVKVMIPVYTVEALSSLPLPAIKKIAQSLGVTPQGDLRRKATWVESIVLYQQSAIKPVAQEVASNTTELPAATEALLVEIAENLQKAQAKIDELRAICESGIVAIDRVLPPVQTVELWWWDNHHGTVTVDGEKRQFRVISLYGDRPVVELQTSNGTWVHSWWETAKNNRYINAVLAEIPNRLDAIHAQILESDPFRKNDEIWDGNDFLGYEDNEPPNRGDNGRGRIEAVGNECDWVEF